MDVSQRFLRRKFLNENMDIFLRESAYHRNNDEAEDIPAVPVWHWDEPEGSGDGIF